MSAPSSLDARRCGRAAGLAILLLLAACGGGELPGLPTTGANGPAALPAPTLTATVDGIKALRLDWGAVPGATAYRVMASPDGVQPFAPVGDDEPASSLRHDRQVLLPELLGVHHRLAACNAQGCSDSAPVSLTAAVLNTGIGYFKASNAGGSFGASIALSADGLTLAIGTPGDGSGAAYVFVRGAAGWALQADIKPGNAAFNDSFGARLALSADGQHLAVAAPRRNGNDGAVYLFERSGTSWGEVAELAPLVPGEATTLGQSLAMSADGSTLVVGDDAGFGLLPEAHVYTRGPAGWGTTPDTLPLADPVNLLSATFAEALAVSGNGDTIAVASRAQALDPGDPATPGAVYVFTRSAGVWSVQARVTASNAGNGDDFGSSLALSSDGQTLTVGARNEDSPSAGVNGGEGNGLLNSGAVYVFARSGNAWSQQAYVKASNPSEFSYFGGAVALSADGGLLAVGSAEEHSSDHGLGGNGADNADYARPQSGATYLFRRQGTTWRQTAYVKASYPDAYDRFGSAVALSGDGQTLAVGAPDEASASTGIGGDAQDNSNAGSGAVYLY